MSQYKPLDTTICAPDSYTTVVLYETMGIKHVIQFIDKEMESSHQVFHNVLTDEELRGY